MALGSYSQPEDPKTARPPQNKKNETVKLQSEITNEISRDAPHIARMVFGDAKDHPDVVGLPNQQLDAIYHQKFVEQDREWLQAEARRDPEQFLKVSERIGVKMPDPNAPPPQAAPAPVPMPPPVAPPMLPPAPPPMAPPMAAVPQPMPLAPGPMPGPALPVAAPAPVILGPNGQPLPPSVPAMAEGGVVTQPTLALIGERGPEAVVPLGPQPGDAPMEPTATPVATPTPPPPPISPWDDLIRQHLPEQHQDLANDPRFIRTVAAGARAESSDDPRAFQLGYKANDPRTWNTYGGRGLWQFDINKGAKGYGVPEEQLLDPHYQASVIVPEYAANYKRLLAANPKLSDEQLAAQVYAATEYPSGTVGGKWQPSAVTAKVGAYPNYVRAYGELATAMQTGA